MKRKLFLGMIILFFSLIILVQCDNPVYAAETSGLTNGSVYNLMNKASGKCLNVNYGTDANGTNVTQFTKDGTIEQRFKLVYNSSRDSYKLYAMCSSTGTNRVVDIYRPIQSGANVDIWTPNDNDAQDMIITNRGNGYYSIHPRYNTGLALTSNGTSNGSGAGTSSSSAGNVYVSTYSGTDNQIWSFMEIAKCYYNAISSQDHSLINSYTEPYLTELGYSYFSHSTNISTGEFLSDLTSSGIFIFHGHGNAGVMALYDESGEQLIGLINSTDITSLPDLSLSPIKLALLYHCYSANVASDKTSTLNAVSGMGAQCAIGWSDEIRSTYVNYWNGLFWEKIWRYGGNILNALEYADYQLNISYNINYTKLKDTRDVKGNVLMYL